jgi:hypothetical protein
MAVSRGDRALAWRERLRRFQGSDSTVAEFCRREGVSVPSFYQWRRRLAETPAVSPSKNRRGSPPSSAFQPVLLTGGAVVTVELPGGVRIELPAEQALVRAVVAELLAGHPGPRGDA